jgi:hypothetical protein
MLRPAFVALAASALVVACLPDWGTPDEIRETAAAYTSPVTYDAASRCPYTYGVTLQRLPGESIDHWARRTNDKALRKCGAACTDAGWSCDIIGETSCVDSFLDICVGTAECCPP